MPNTVKILINTDNTTKIKSDETWIFQNTELKQQTHIPNEISFIISEVIYNIDSSSRRNPFEDLGGSERA